MRNVEKRIKEAQEIISANNSMTIGEVTEIMRISKVEGNARNYELLCNAFDFGFTVGYRQLEKKYVQNLPKELTRREKKDMKYMFSRSIERMKNITDPEVMYLIFNVIKRYCEVTL